MMTCRRAKTCDKSAGPQTFPILLKPGYTGHMLIDNTVQFVKETLADAEGGHDWWHVYRVWKMSIALAKNEKVNFEIVELGALLHDIADAKFYDGDETIGPKKARAFLESQNVLEETVAHVENIIKHISFRHGNTKAKFTSRELDIVQDADRLDAMGAIGIARTFNYGGFRNREIYNPDSNASKSTSINHFNEKLLRLKDSMNTDKGRLIAERRHAFMENYLKEFFSEWEGEN